MKNVELRWPLQISVTMLFLLPAVERSANLPGPLTADEVMERVVAMNQIRAKALEAYSSLRSYHLECHCLSPKQADIVVWVDYSAPNKKDFTIASESGSGSARYRVFRKLLEAERESLLEENERRSAVTPDNHTFQEVSYQRNDSGEFYVLAAQPRSKNKLLFRGRIWVNSKDFAITRVEGEPAAQPSWWTLKTDFKRNFQEVGLIFLGSPIPARARRRCAPSALQS